MPQSDKLYVCQKLSQEKFVMLYLRETRSGILSANSTLKITVFQGNLKPTFLINFLRELKCFADFLQFKFFEGYFIKLISVE